MSYIEIGIEKTAADGTTTVEPVGKFPIFPGIKRQEYLTAKGSVWLDLSRIRPGMRGPKLLGVDIKDLPPRDVALNRLTGLGNQTLEGSWNRLAVRVVEPKGVLRRG